MTARTPAPGSRAMHDVIAERQRQVTDEGWSAKHDDTHRDGQMATAAACYAVFEPARIISPSFTDWAVDCWPWSYEWFKPSDRRRNLVKAAALMIAEIERLDREEPHDDD